LLMAVSATIFFYMSSLALSLSWSLLIALAGTLGPQVWSTASRVMWSDTWAVLLLAGVVWLLLALEKRRGRQEDLKSEIADLKSDEEPGSESSTEEKLRSEVSDLKTSNLNTFFPLLLATLLAWGYFVRPTNAIPIMAITIYILLFHRKLMLRYLITVMVSL